MNNRLNKYYYSKDHTSNNYTSQMAYVEHNLYKNFDNITFNNTINLSEHINQYTTDVVDTYKTNTVSNLTK